MRGVAGIRIDVGGGAGEDGFSQTPGERVGVDWSSRGRVQDRGDGDVAQAQQLEGFGEAEWPVSPEPADALGGSVGVGGDREGLEGVLGGVQVQRQGGAAIGRASGREKGSWYG